ncbi:sialate O-acetylesterase [Pedobacter sp. HDW13]|uniref:sialate O-acetylesterase n=1 Tax=Pedobacter sp. HDW13 TaxID=2714940 RepID=UPI0014073449|nr:sialate O-acetylesterase [Pedobacter sp. HDW13]QIL37891.1 sialate O-acetylesterase [Pedobacter sp. HDW13]
MKTNSLIPLLFLLPVIVHANVKLPAIIADQMVLQQQKAVSIWGWADPGEIVHVNGSWDHRQLRVKADSKGEWLVLLKTPKAGGPYRLTINGKNQLEIKNVLIGEVWLCSGQSNMEFPLQKKTAWKTGVLDYENEIIKANYPQIRMFTVTQTVAQSPQKNVTGNWESCNPATAGNFSAVAYYFAVTLTKKLNCPIGLIHSSWGATPAESWVKKQTLENNADLSAILTDYNKEVDQYKNKLEVYEKTLTQWKRQADTAIAVPKKPIEPAQSQKSATKLYNGMIAPLIPFTIKGVIWYQGEANTNRAYQYRKLFPELIRSWRKDRKSKFPFYFVQIAMHYKQLPEIREAQLLTLRSVPRTAMAVITDVSDSLDIHPRNKEVPGRRLGLAALSKTYHLSGPNFSGPIYRSMKINADTIILRFKYAEGLVVKDSDKLAAFTIAGSNHSFLPAEAVIKGDEIWVFSKLIKKPVAVRFAWENYCRPNLFNAAGLPASPFRTDSGLQKQLLNKNVL